MAGCIRGRNASTRATDGMRPLEIRRLERDDILSIKNGKP